MDKFGQVQTNLDNFEQTWKCRQGEKIKDYQRLTFLETDFNDKKAVHRRLFFAEAAQP